MHDYHTEQMELWKLSILTMGFVIILKDLPNIIVNVLFSISNELKYSPSKSTLIFIHEVFRILSNK